MDDVWTLLESTYPGVRLESEIQGWAFLERFEDGIQAYERIEQPSPMDDRWVGVCYFQTLRDMEALEALFRAANRDSCSIREPTSVNVIVVRAISRAKV